MIVAVLCFEDGPMAGKQLAWPEDAPLHVIVLQLDASSLLSEPLPERGTELVPIRTLRYEQVWGNGNRYSYRLAGDDGATS